MDALQKFRAHVAMALMLGCRLARGLVHCRVEHHSSTMSYCSAINNLFFIINNLDSVLSNFSVPATRLATQ
jgi:hypothetical protein